jgi:hypothetical protein
MKQNFTVRQDALDGVEAFLSVASAAVSAESSRGTGVTPSAISQAIRALEACIGAVVFIRTTRSVGLNQAGERFLRGRSPPSKHSLPQAGSRVNSGSGRQGFCA